MAAKTRTIRFSKRKTALWVLALSVFIVELLFYTWLRVQCVQAGYAISNETRKQQELKTLQNSLKIELARLKTPETISRVARDHLALGLPDPRQIVVMPKGSGEVK